MDLPVTDFDTNFNQCLLFVLISDKNKNELQKNNKIIEVEGKQKYLNGLCLHFYFFY